MTTRPPVPELNPVTIASLRAAFLGVRWANGPELELAGRLTEGWPGLPGMIWSAVAAHERITYRAVTEGGAETVVFGAAGYPPDPDACDRARADRYTVPAQLPLHARAVAARPRTRVVYADADGQPTAVNKAFLVRPDPSRVTAVKASVRDPAKLLEAARVSRDGPPACLHLQCVLHWFPREFAAWTVAEYGRLLPSGSSLVMTLVVPGAEGGDGLAEAARDSGGRLRPYSSEDVAGWVRAAEMKLADWGVADVRAKEKPWPEDRFASYTGPRVIEAVAVRP